MNSGILNRVTFQMCDFAEIQADACKEGPQLSEQYQLYESIEEN